MQTGYRHLDYALNIDLALDYCSNGISTEDMLNRQCNHHNHNRSSHPVLQILESHAVQELIRAVSDFIRHEAGANKARGKDSRDKRDRRQHRKRHELRGHRRYEDDGHQEGGRDARRQGKEQLNGYHGPVYGPVNRSTILTK